MPTVRVRTGINSIVTLPDGTPWHLRENMPVDTTDPRLRLLEAATGTAWQEWFAADDDTTRKRKVEQATANPGETR